MILATAIHPSDISFVEQFLSTFFVSSTFFLKIYSLIGQVIVVTGHTFKITSQMLPRRCFLPYTEWPFFSISCWSCDNSGETWRVQLTLPYIYSVKLCRDTVRRIFLHWERLLLLRWSMEGIPTEGHTTEATYFSELDVAAAVTSTCPTFSWGPSEAILISATKFSVGGYRHSVGSNGGTLTLKLRLPYIHRLVLFFQF